MQEKSLHELLREYRAGKLSRTLMHNAIAKALYREPHRFNVRDEDEVGEIYARFPHRIDALIDRFDDQGAPFEFYLASCLRYLGMSLRRSRTREYDRHFIIEEEAEKSYVEAESHSSDVSWDLCERESGHAFGIKEGTIRSRLAILCLKHAWVLDDSDIAYVAVTGGIDSGLLLKKVAYVRDLCRIFKERFEHRRMIREASWVRLRILERRIAREGDAVLRTRLTERLTRERFLFEGRKKALRKTRILIPNSAVAKALGIPKGTVDATIHTLRKRALISSSCRGNE